MQFSNDFVLIPSNNRIFQQNPVPHSLIDIQNSFFRKIVLILVEGGPRDEESIFCRRERYFSRGIFDILLKNTKSISQIIFFAQSTPNFIRQG